MALVDSRDERIFPKLAPEEIDRVRRFGEIRHYAAGEKLFVTGDIAPGLFALVRGRVNVIRRDPLGHLAPIVEMGPGDIIGEIGQLSGRPSLVDVLAAEDVEALLIAPDHLRQLMLAEPATGSCGR